MQGIRRKIVYVSLFEVIAIAITTSAFSWLSDRPLIYAGTASVGSSIVAVLWTLAYNSVFENWEARRAVRGRSWSRRVVHALGFEGGLVVLLVPLIAVTLGISLWQAFVYDLGLVVFFLIYTFTFNLLFDKVFGLPESAMPDRQPA